jgi:glycosyltransferase involved in cell wall biosynthesis
MRVILLHNRYRAEGGEERAVAEIAALLARRGHPVEVLERSSSALSRSGAAGALIRGGVGEDDVGASVARFRADVVHAHNIHPLFGWRALAAARAAGARTVLQLHNFRLFCAIAIAYRDGGPCFRCRGRNTLPGLRLRCRGSFPEAAVYAAALHRQQPLLYEYVDRFVVLSDASGARLAELGLPSDRAVTLPNFIPASRVAPQSQAHRGEYALVSGRLVEEKGFDTAIAAARRAGVPLIVAGDGPDAPRLTELARGGDVRFAGWLSRERLDEVRRGAAVVLAPSRWEEPCPYSVLDAHAAGVPVLASDRGGLTELVAPGEALPAADPEAWEAALSKLWADGTARSERGERGLALARGSLGEDRYYARLMALYGLERLTK